MRFARLILLCLASAAILAAAPKLRLSTTAIGPISVITGQEGPAQSVQAGNTGDGDLALTATPSAPWLRVSIGSASACAQFRMCTPIQISLKTAGLARGNYTGVVTVSAPKAADAPQTITVTVEVSGGVPDSLDLYLPPNSMTTATFTTASPLTTAVNNPQGGPVLSIAAVGGGSFSYSYSYQVTAMVPAGTAENDYKGGIGVASAASHSDVRIMPVTVHVTTQPIASLSPVEVQIRAPQGEKAERSVDLTNIGKGTLTVTGATVSGGAWLSVKTTGNRVTLTADPAGLKPGAYQAAISVISNAKNAPSVIPVQMEVTAARAGRP